MRTAAPGGKCLCKEAHKSELLNGEKQRVEWVDTNDLTDTWLYWTVQILPTYITLLDRAYGRSSDGNP